MNQIIEIEPLCNSSHRNQSWDLPIPPEGYAIIPDDMVIPETYPFVNITVDEIDGVMAVTSMEAGVVPKIEEPPVEDNTPVLSLENRVTSLERENAKLLYESLID